MEIRRFQPNDRLVFNIPPFPDKVSAWVVTVDKPIGYVAYGLLPGLPDQADLYIYVRPEYRRQKYGSRLLHFLVRELRDTPVRQISTLSESGKASSNIGFFRYHRFYPAHVECQLTRTITSNMPLADVDLVQPELPEAAELLLDLYPRSFSSTPWFQPYVSVDEILGEYFPTGELLFLHKSTRPIGFVGITYHGRIADIEPLGVIDGYKGMGFGRKLLVAALQHLRDKHIHQVQLTAWQQNHPALSLYHSVGFQQSGRRTYLAYDVKTGPLA